MRILYINSTNSLALNVLHCSWKKKVEIKLTYFLCVCESRLKCVCQYGCVTHVYNCNNGVVILNPKSRRQCMVQESPNETTPGLKR